MLARAPAYGLRVGPAGRIFVQGSSHWAPAGLSGDLSGSGSAAGPAFVGVRVIGFLAPGSWLARPWRGRANLAGAVVDRRVGRSAESWDGSRAGIPVADWG